MMWVALKVATVIIKGVGLMCGLRTRFVAE